MTELKEELKKAQEKCEEKGKCGGRGKSKGRATDSKEVKALKARVTEAEGKLIKGSLTAQTIA